MELTVGANQFFWKPEPWSALYDQLAQAPVDRVVLGELVCSKRLPFYQDRIPAAITTLLEAGKQPVLTSLALVSAMCEGLGQYATGGVEAMQLERYWHPRCSWYGPAGIGTGRGIRGFRDWHQIPFLNGLPDRVGDAARGHLFADGDFVGFTAWPGMHMSVSGDGWLGIAPSGQEITMRSLDFWRCENGMIRENWVLVDLLHVYHQLDVDVFARLREFNKARR